MIKRNVAYTVDDRLCNVLPLIQGCIARILYWGPQNPRAEGARIEAPKAPRGVGIGEGVSFSPTD